VGTHLTGKSGLFGKVSQFPTNSQATFKIDLVADEFAAGVAMIGALDSTQQAKAITSATKSGTMNQTEAGKDDAVVPYQGDQAKRAVYRPAAAAARAGRAVRRRPQRRPCQAQDGRGRPAPGHHLLRLDTTYFAWAGPTSADGAFYFRVQSLVILIEFDCQSGGPASGSVEAAADPTKATGVASGGGGGSGASRNHILSSAARRRR
jgi:hypothetical protein